MRQIRMTESHGQSAIWDIEAYELPSGYWGFRFPGRDCAGLMIRGWNEAQAWEILMNDTCYGPLLLPLNQTG